MCLHHCFLTPGVINAVYPHSEKKGYQNGALGVLLLQMVPFFQRGTEIVPLRVPYYGQSNSAPRGTISVPFFSECLIAAELSPYGIFFQG